MKDKHTQQTTQIMPAGGKRPRRAALHNLGCKVNAYEMDVMAQLLMDQSYEIVPFEDEADVYIVNTCTVTNIADRKSRQMLHRARRRNPAAIVVAVGCYVQTDTEAALRDEGIDLCIGNNKKSEIAQILEHYLEHREGLTDLRQPCAYEDIQLERLTDRTRAYIKIQDGCNQYCSYCIIPYARGRVRSRRAEEILREVRGLASRGGREFVLTGIHISSYGADLGGAAGKRGVEGGELDGACLLALLRELDRVDGVERLRIGSLEPRIVTEDFVRGLREIRRLCPHFHLSLQSGSDAVLRRMNRRYTTADYAAAVERIRAAYDLPAITTDIIVGFPGETEEEYQQTLAFAERVGFYEMHIFKYSRRKGTPAAQMPGQLTEREKARRSDGLEALERRLTEVYLAQWAGRTAEALFEERRSIQGEDYYVGHTREYVHVALRCPGREMGEGSGIGGCEGMEALEGDLVNQICQVVLTDKTLGEYVLVRR